jgi:hypothetical protein
MVNLGAHGRFDAGCEALLPGSSRHAEMRQAHFFTGLAALDPPRGGGGVCWAFPEALVTGA